jgi:hypothetical protein
VALWDLRNLKMKLHAMVSHTDDILQVHKGLGTCAHAHIRALATL